MYSKSFRKNLPNVNISYMIGMCKTWGTKTRNPQKATMVDQDVFAFCGFLVLVPHVLPIPICEASLS